MPALSLPTDCVLLQNKELHVVVGNGKRRLKPCFRGTYPGIWSLTSIHRIYNVFGNYFAGIIPNMFRHCDVSVVQHDERTCTLQNTKDTKNKFSMNVTYRLNDPCYIDLACEITDKTDNRRQGCAHREIEFASYINSPEDNGVYFPSKGKTARHLPEEPRVGSTIFPVYEDEKDFETWPEDQRSFHWSRSGLRFDEPCMYGRLQNMALIFIFNKTDKVRFSVHPQGGGASLIPGKLSPAWDFYWCIPEPEYAPGRKYVFQARIVYKEFVSERDVSEEYEKAAQALDSKTALKPK